MKNPWDKGWIPPRAKKHAVHRPAPEGWVRIRRPDCTHYVRQGSNILLQDVIIGKPGTKWSLWLDYGPDDQRPADFEAKSLAALLVWYKIETAARADTTSQSDAHRQALKAARLAHNYGMGRLGLESLMLRGHQVDTYSYILDEATTTTVK